MAKKIELPDDPDYKGDDTVEEMSAYEVDAPTGAEDDSPESRVAGPELDDEDDEFELEVIDDTPPEDRGREHSDSMPDDPTEEELDEYGSKVQKRLKELTWAKHEERRKAEAFERERNELQRAAIALAAENRKMQEFINMGQTAYVEKSKAYAQALTESARTELAQAYDAGDSKAITAAQEKLTKAQLLQQEADNFRVPPLQDKPQPVYNQHQEVQRAPVQPDSQTQTWHKANPWFRRAGDEDMTAYAMQLHAQLANQYGPAFVSSPEYFQHIDDAMRKVFPDRAGKRSGGTTPAASKRQTPVVAPASRGKATKKVRLTKTQIAIADKLGISYAGYARQQAALEKNNG